MNERGKNKERKEKELLISSINTNSDNKGKHTYKTNLIFLLHNSILFLPNSDFGSFVFSEGSFFLQFWAPESLDAIH